MTRIDADSFTKETEAVLLRGQIPLIVEGEIHEAQTHNREKPTTRKAGRVSLLAIRRSSSESRARRQAKGRLI